jgi:Ca2+-binding RTX toxin-like protein
MAFELTPGFWVLEAGGDTFNGSADEVTGSDGPDSITANPLNTPVVVAARGGDDTIEATGAGVVAGGAGDDRITVFDGALGVGFAPGNGADVVRLASLQDTAAAPVIFGGPDADVVNSGDGAVDTFIVDAGALGSIPPLVDNIRDVSIRGVVDDFSRIVTIYGFEPGDQLQIGGAAGGSAQVGQGVELYNAATGQLNEPIGRGAFIAMGDVAVQVVSANGQQAFSSESDFNDRVQFDDESSTPTFQIAPEGSESGTDGDDTLEGAAGGDAIYGNGGADRILGRAGNDQVYGNQGADQIYGNQGDDFVFGGQGNDFVFGGQGIDEVYGNQGADEIYGNKGNDLLFGGQDDDLLFGGQDNDQLFGNKGDDSLWGNVGDDTLNGGTGSDEFVLNGGGSDRIQDFDASEGDRFGHFSGFDRFDLADVADGLEVEWQAGSDSGEVILEGLDRADFDNSWLL